MGNKKARLLGGLVGGKSMLLWVRFNAVADAINSEVPDEFGLSGVHIAYKLIDVLRVHLPVMSLKRDTLLVHINNMGESYFMLAHTPSVDDVRKVCASLDMLIGNHFVSPVGGLIRSLASIVYQTFGFVNRQNGQFVKLMAVT